MKSTDLMIGDWVLYEGSPRTIALLDDAGFALMRPGEDAEIIVERDLQPIHLTPEILKKNGFKNKSVGPDLRKFRWISDDGRTELTIWMDDKIPMEIRKNVDYEDEISYSLPFPYFVNELQHGLHFCMIDKEIVL